MDDRSPTRSSDRPDDRPERLGISAEDLAEAEPNLTPGLVSAVLDTLVRFEGALLELTA